MFLINDILVSDELLEKRFCCDLGACRCACCVEGDFGAPLEPEERKILQALQPDVVPHLDASSQEAIREQGVDTYYPGMNDYGTTLRPDGACVFTVFDENGVALCGIEQQYRAGRIDFKKPLSCELYPIRVTRNPVTGFTSLSFDDCNIFQPAGVLARELGMHVIQFHRSALIRGYVVAFYNLLYSAA